MASEDICGRAQRDDDDDDDDDHSPRLSTHTLAALHEFLSEHHRPQEEQQDEAEQEQQLINDRQEPQILSEDWRLSQFWYDKHTAFIVAQELHHLSLESDSPVACIACPSLYVELKKSFPAVRTHLFEYDQRFRRYGADFAFYDYNYPENLASEYHRVFQIIVADPPYLSEECLQKTAQAMKLLAKDESAYFILLTGAVQCDRAFRLLGARPCGFRPSHQSKLGNEFTLYTNYDPIMRLGGWEHF